MTLSEKRGLQTLLVTLGTALMICAVAAIGSVSTANAEVPQEAPDERAAPDAPTWSSPYNVSNSSDVESEMPALTVTDSGVAHVVWEEGGELYHSYRAAGSWSDPSQVPYTGTSEQPALEAGPGERVHLVYVDDVDIFYADVFYTVWDGSTWSLPKNVSQTAESGEFSQVSGSPDIALAPDGSIHVVAVEHTASGKKIFYGRSDDGSAWPVYAAISSAYGEDPSVDVADRDTVYVAYKHETEHDVYVLNGTISDWSLPQNISNTPGTFSTAPDLALGSNGAPEIVWQETLTDTHQILYSRGEAWTSVIELSADSTGGFMPSLSIDIFGHRHVAWNDEGYPFVIRHTWTSDPLTWSTPEPVYSTALPIEDVGLDVGRDGVVHAVWTEVRAGNGEILYASETFVDVFDVFLPLVLRGR